MKVLLLRCPACKHTMKYQAVGEALEGKRKVCVYCGKSFLVKKSIVY